MIQIAWGALVVPANTQIQGQLLGGRPVILQIQPELCVLRLGDRTQSRYGCREQNLVGNARRTRGVHVVEELRIDVFRVLRGELHLLQLEAGLDRVIAVPCDVLEDEVILQPGAALALVLGGHGVRRTGVQDRRVLLCLQRVDRAVAEVHGLR